jgi:peptide deformylase
MKSTTTAFFHIRSFGDAVLFTPTQSVNFTAEEELQNNISKMMSTLHDQGGVGIAANQCANIPAPAPSIIIAGPVNAQIRINAQARYPNGVVPDPEVFINPTILERSPETHFPGEGCLSIPCPFRGRVARHRWILLQYYDIQGTKHEKKFFDMTAHILQHECDHLQGVVFLHRLLAEMQPGQREEIATLINLILSQEQTPPEQRPSTAPFSIERDDSGNLLIQKEIIIHTLSSLDRPVLEAVYEAAITT